MLTSVCTLLPLISPESLLQLRRSRSAFISVEAVAISPCFVLRRLWGTECSQKAPEEEAGSWWGLTSGLSESWSKSLFCFPAPMPVCAVLPWSPLSYIFAPKNLLERLQAAIHTEPKYSPTVNESLKRLWVWKGNVLAYERSSARFWCRSLFGSWTSLLENWCCSEKATVIASGPGSCGTALEGSCLD